MSGPKGGSSETHGAARVTAAAAMPVVSTLLRETSSAAARSELTPAACVPVRRRRFGLTAAGLKAEAVLTRQRPEKYCARPSDVVRHRRTEISAEAGACPGSVVSPQSVA